MPFQKGNKFGGAKKGHPCWNLKQIKGSKWMQRGAELKRIRPNEINGYLADGWTFGRPQSSVETRRKLSDAHWGKDHPSAFKKGHRTWNIGDKMPEEACISMSVGRLAKYGIKREQIIDARKTGMSWCSHHLQFELNSVFRVLKNGKRSTRCNFSHTKYTPWYKERFKKQGGVCGICGEPEPRLDALALDHHHNCPDSKHTRKQEPRVGCICCRGLLCSLCNPRLGYFEGFITPLINPQFMDGSWEKKSLDYLSTYPLQSLSGDSQ